MGEPKLNPRMTQAEKATAVEVFKLLKAWKRDLIQKRVVKVVKDR